MRRHHTDRLESVAHSELYQEFISFIQTDIQRERKAAHRRLFSVLLWCFVVPAITSTVLLFLVKFGVLPRRFNRHLDWLIVIFPVAYALYMLGIDFVKEAPIAIRRGGIAATLGRAIDDEKWRNRVCAELRQRFLSRSSENAVQPQGWHWVIENFQIDLKNLQNRTRYLTALAGAVFFLIFQGVDALDETQTTSTWSASSMMGWFEASSSTLTQFVGMGIFLVLLYVSGNQVYLSLLRYLQCARLVLPENQRESSFKQS